MKRLKLSTRRASVPLLLGLMVLAALLWAAPPTASAHGYIVRAVPEDRAVLERAPTRLQYWFSEGLEPDFSTINVRDQDGNVIASGGVDPLNDSLLKVQLEPGLPDGAYIVELRPAFASDGHVVAESRVFFVGEEIGGVSGQAASDQAIPLEVVWRSITLSATALLFGVVAVYAWVLVPAWGSAKHPAGLLPPRVMRRVRAVMGIALLIAIAGNVLALLQQAMVFFNVDMARVVSGNLWAVVRIGSRFGDIWNFRMGFLLIIGAMLLASMYYASRQPKTVRPFLAASTWIAALVLGSHSALSHAAGALVLPWVGVAADWIHLTAVAFWVGGVVALTFILPVALKPYEGEARRLALLAAMRRFSRFATAALVLVIVTGLYNASTWYFTPSDLQSSFALSLAVKVGMVALLVSVGALHHIALRPERYARFEGLIQRTRGFLPTLRLESLLALLVLIAAGWLSATPVPVPAFADEDVPAPRAETQVGGLTVGLTITPGGPGVNTYDAQVIGADGQPLDGATVALRKVAPERDQRGPWSPAEAVDSGLYVTAGDEINESGLWWTLLDITPPGAAEPLRAAFTWEISDAASVIETLPPGWYSVVLLIVGLGAMVWAFWPMLRGFYARQDLSAANLFILAWSVGGTVIFMVAGYVLLSESQRQYEASLNPPPTIVNSVLPDQASLERGAALYESACDGWTEAQIARSGLVERLPRTRDEELFRFTLEGWRGLPGCDGIDGEQARWDVVNTLRTWERERVPTASAGDAAQTFAARTFAARTLAAQTLAAQTLAD